MKRIYVPVSDELDKAISDYASASNVSKAGALSSLIEGLSPVLIEMTNAINTAKYAPAAALKGMAAKLDSTIAEANQLNLDVSDRTKPKVNKARKAG